MKTTTSKDSACYLRSLGGHPAENVFYGLTVFGGVLKADGRIFPCCNGTGNTWDEESKTLSFCNLAPRLKSTNQLLIFYAKSTKQSQLDLDAFKLSIIEAESLISLSKKKGGQAFMYSPQKGIDAVSIWSKAFFATWRLGLNVHVVDFSNKELMDEAYQHFVSVKKHPVFLFIINVSNLHHADQHALFDLWINRAYQSQSHTWIHFKKITQDIQEAPSPSGAYEKRSMSKKLEELKAKRDPLSMLSTPLRSRLEEMFSHAPKNRV